MFFRSFFLFNLITFYSLLSALNLFAAEPGDFDKYGGYKGLKFSATGFFYTVKSNDQWWMVSPEGNAFFMLGVGAVNLNGDEDIDGKTYSAIVQTKYAMAAGPDDGFGADWKSRWAYFTRKRLTGWGFNHLGTFAFPPANSTLQADGTLTPPGMGTLAPNQMPEVITNRAGRDSMGADRPWHVKNIFGPVFTAVEGSKPYFPDVFDPKFKESQDFAAANSTKSSPWVVYVFMDQTDEMRGVNQSHNHLGFITMATNFQMTVDPKAFLGSQTYSDPKMYAKYALRDFLKNKYITLDALNAAWGTGYTSWDSNGGWGVGTGVLDEKGANLGNYWYKSTPEGKSAFPALKADLDTFAASIMRQWYKTVYESFKNSGTPYLLATNNLDPPKTYVYEGLRSLDGTQTFADIIVAQNDTTAGQWADFLDRPFSAWNLSGYFTAENDSPLGYIGQVDGFTADDATKTITIQCNTCDFFWAGNPKFGPVHNIFTRFSSLPPTITRGARMEPQFYKSATVDWINNKTFRVSQYGYYNGKYEELRDAIKIGDSFRRIVTMNAAGPFETQEARGIAYATQLKNAVLEKTPSGIFYRIGAHIWQVKDNSHFFWEVYNFGLITHRDNAYDGKEACFNATTDSNGYPTLPEQKPPYMQDACYGDFITSVQNANLGVYSLRPNSASPQLPAPKFMKIDIK